MWVMAHSRYAHVGYGPLPCGLPQGDDGDGEETVMRKVQVAPRVAVSFAAKVRVRDKVWDKIRGR